MEIDDINLAQKAPPAQQRPPDHAGPTGGPRVTLTPQNPSVRQSDHGGRFDPIDHWGQEVAGMTDILNFAFCEIARISHSRDSRPRNQNPVFSGVTPHKHIAKCREMAAEAERVAACVSAEARSRYIELERQLTSLADEMEMGLSSGD
jgi:hypothetical protein